MKLYDPQYTGNFGEREININDVIGRLDMDIYMEAVASDFDIEEMPEIEDDIVRELYAWEGAEVIARDIFKDEIKSLCPHVVNHLHGRAKAWCKEHTYGRLRIESSKIMFENEEDAIACKMRWKRYKKYEPETFDIVIRDRPQTIIDWLNENIGERYLAWKCPRSNTYCFYDEADSAHFMLVWG